MYFAHMCTYHILHTCVHTIHTCTFHSVDHSNDDDETIATNPLLVGSREHDIVKETRTHAAINALGKCACVCVCVVCVLCVCVHGCVHGVLASSQGQF